MIQTGYKVNLFTVREQARSGARTVLLVNYCVDKENDVDTIILQYRIEAVQYWCQTKERLARRAGAGALGCARGADGV